MKSLTALVFCALVVGTVEPAHGQEQSCPGFNMEGLNPAVIDRHYAMKAVEIMQMALRGDRGALEELVDPEARLELWHGDTVTTGRTTGADAAIRFAHDLDPTGYRIGIENPEPIALSSTDCTWQVEIFFSTSNQSEGVSAAFHFADDRLDHVVAQRLDMIEGALE